MRYRKYFYLLLLTVVVVQSCQKPHTPVEPEPEPEPQPTWVADTTLIPQIIAQIDSDRIRNTIQTLQDFGTRYNYSYKCYEAAQWIKGELESYGYEVDFQTYFANRFRNIFFADENNGWLVGNAGTVLKTRDGGYSWERQETNLTTDFSAA